MKNSKPVLAVCLSPESSEDESLVLGQITGLETIVKLYSDGLVPTKLNGGYFSRFRYQLQWIIQSFIHQTKFNSLNEYSLAKSFVDECVTTVWADSYFTALAILDICKQLSLPMVVNFNQSSVDLSLLLRNNLENLQNVMDYSSRIIVNSIQSKDILTSAGVPEKLVLINNSTEEPSFYLIDCVTRGILPIHLAMCRPSEARSTYLAILAFSELFKDFPNTRLLISGEEKLYSEFIDLITYYNLQNAVSIFRHYNKPSLGIILNFARAIAQNSGSQLSNDSSRSFVDILDSCVSNPPILKTGFVIEENNVHDIATKLSMILQKTKLARLSWLKAHPFISQSFHLIDPAETTNVDETAKPQSADMENKIRVAVLVKEFFSNNLPYGVGKGGYGILARNYIAEYIPNSNIEIDTIIWFNETNTLLTIIKDGRKKVIYLPKPIDSAAESEVVRIMNEYDVFLSIEFQDIAEEVMRRTTRNQKLIMYIQAPCTDRDWDAIASVNFANQTLYRTKVQTWELLQKLFISGRLVAISQGRFLIDKARETYKLPPYFNAEFVPNPVEVPFVAEEELLSKKDMIISLARLDGIKRPWIIAEVAKRLPEYEFVFLGQMHESSMHTIMEPYMNIPNITYAGHIEGEEKDKYLREAKLLINSSISEAVPVSFLEALGYGVPIVSNQNPDDIVSNFGIAIEQRPGDGFDMVNDFVQAIKKLMSDDSLRLELASGGIRYIREIHSVQRFIDSLRGVIADSVS